MKQRNRFTHIVDDGVRYFVIIGSDDKHPFGGIQTVGDRIDQTGADKIGYQGVHGQGGFLREDKDILYCVVSRLEVTKLKQVVQSIDPQAFLSIFDVQEVEGGRIGKKK